MTEKDSMDKENTINEEIDLIAIISVLWKGKKLISSLTIFAAVSSIIFSLLLTNMYRSESVLQSRTSQDSGGLSQFSGLASMAGISLPTAGGDGAVEVMAIIKSREFVKHLVTFEDILASLMAVKDYDPSSRKLSYDKNSYDSETKSWIQPSNKARSYPSYIDAHEVYLGMMSISKDTKTGLINISVEHRSPVFAKEFLDLIIQEANALKRNKDIATTDRALSYLKEQLSQTVGARIKDSINMLIESQLETRMMANIHEEYSLIKIEPPFIPENRFFPKRSIICILGTLIGMMLSVMIVLTKHYAVNNKK